MPSYPSTIKRILLLYFPDVTVGIVYNLGDYVSSDYGNIFEANFINYALLYISQLLTPIVSVIPNKKKLTIHHNQVQPYVKSLLELEEVMLVCVAEFFEYNKHVSSTYHSS